MKRFCIRNHDTEKTGRWKSNGRCRLCANDKRMERRRKDPISMRQARRLWVKNHPDEIREQSWTKQGIRCTVAIYNKLIAIQNHLCAICKKRDTFTGRRLAVDHDHRTGVIRGLLCHRCNHYVLKVVEDFSYLLRRAEHYLNASLPR